MSVCRARSSMRRPEPATGCLLSVPSAVGGRNARERETVKAFDVSARAERARYAVSATGDAGACRASGCGGDAG